MVTWFLALLPPHAAHFVLENICTSARRNLAGNHPLHDLLTRACKLNAGAIAENIATLLPVGTGAFDNLMAVGGQSMATGLLPGLLARWTWDTSYLETDMENRGVAGIPEFSYRQDAGAVYTSLLKYATGVLEAAYGEDGDEEAAIEGDLQLRAFLDDLSTGNRGQTLYGFPSSGDVTSGAQLGRIAAQVRACCHFWMV